MAGVERVFMNCNDKVIAAFLMSIVVISFLCFVFYQIADAFKGWLDNRIKKVSYSHHEYLYHRVTKIEERLKKNDRPKR